MGLKINPRATLTKIDGLKGRLTEDDRNFLIDAVNDPTKFALGRIAAVRSRAATARPPREQFGARSHAAPEASNEPVYQPSDLEISMIKFVTAQKLFDELRDKADATLSINPTMPKSLQKQVIEAAADAGTAQSDLSKVLTSTHLKRMRDESALKQAPTHDDPLPGFQQVASPVKIIGNAPASNEPPAMHKVPGAKLA
jgi:hypothetical protein